MADSLTDQLKPAQQLREIFDEIKESAGAVTDAYSAQFKMIKQIVDVMSALKPKDTTEDFKQMNDTVKEVQKNVEASGEAGSGSMKKLGINAEALEKKFGKVAKASAYSAAAIAGLKQGFKNVVALSKSFIGFLTSTAEGMFRIGTSIASIPFKMFKGLINMAQESGGDMTDLLQEIENVRKQFGQFGQSSAKAVFDVQKNLGGFSETGLSAWRVFGTLAERMQYIRELATGMGVAWSHMVTHMDMKKEGGHILAYQKGLGLAAEEMKGLYDRANAAGKPITQVGVEMTKYSYAMAKEFGLSAKEVSRDVGKAMKDVKHFGQMTVKEINVAATYARKLNIEFEKITATLDSFETFDTSADNAAKLAQSFGANVDAFKMMEAQNPAEQMDMLRKAMFAAGKDADKMNRQELKLLATTVGMDEATAKQAFSFKNQGVALDDIKKKANSVENAQMSQAEAMKTLAGAIERMVKSGALDKMSGFFDAFTKGLLAGVRSSPAFIKMMWNIRLALRGTWFEGFKLGRELSKTGEVIGKLIAQISQLFDPKELIGNARKVRMIFKDFFHDLVSGNFSFSKLMDKLKELFFDFFSHKTQKGKEILESYKKFFMRMSELAGQMIQYFSEKVTKGIQVLADFVRNPSALIEKLKGGGAGAGGFIMKILDPMIKAIKDAWPAFKDATWSLLTAVFDRIKEFFHSETFYSIIKTVGPAMLSVLFGPAITKVLFVGLLDMLSKVLLKGVEQAFEKGAMEQITKFAGSKLGNALGMGAAIGAVIAVSLGISAGMKKFRGQIKGEFTDAQKDVSAGVTGLVDMLTFGLMPDWMLVAIANFGAKLGAALQASLNKVSSGLGDNIMGYLQGYMKFFGGIGDIIFGFLEGDTDRIMSGLGNIISGGLQMIVRGIQMQFITLPMMLGKLIVGLVTGIQSTLWKTVGGLLKSMGLESFGNLFIALGDVASNFGKVIMSVFNLISSAVNWLVTAVTTNFDKISSVIVDVIGWVLKLGNPFYIIYKVVTKVLEWLGVDMSKFYKWVDDAWTAVKDVAGSIIDWITDKVKWVGNKLGALASIFGDWSKKMDEDAAKMQGGGKLSPEQIKEAQAKGQRIGTTTVQSAQEAMKEQAEKGDAVSLITSKGFDVSKAPTKAINFAKEAIANVEEVQKKISELAPEKLKAMTDKVAHIFEPKGDFMKFVQNVNTQIKGPEVEMAAKSISSVSSIFEGLGQLSGQKIGDVGKVIDSVTKFFSPEVMLPRMQALGQAIVWAGDFGLTMTVFHDTLKNSGIIPALQAVQTMVNAANDLDKALSEGNITKMNLKTKLTNVANAVGLGGKANYEIKNRGVNIQIDLKVEINAADMEKAMIMRGKSIIRDRLNNAEYTKQSTTRSNMTNIPETIDQTAANEAYFATGHMG